MVYCKILDLKDSAILFELMCLNTHTHTHAHTHTHTQKHLLRILKRGASSDVIQFILKVQPHE